MEMFKHFKNPFFFAGFLYSQNLDVPWTVHLRKPPPIGKFNLRNTISKHRMSQRYD